MSDGPDRSIVVGASSGIGAALAGALAARGGRTAILARRKDRLLEVAAAARAKTPAAEILVFEHDVADFASIGPAFERAVAALGGLDRLVYASGAMTRTAPTEYSPERDRTIVDVNVTGATAWLDLAARTFEAQRSGVIIGISSIGGERGRPGHPAYNASKAYLTSFLESLRNRLFKAGVNVITVKPGYIDTEMTRGLEGLFWLMSAERCAEAILAAESRSSPSLFVPWRWTLVAAALKCIPSFVFRRLNV